MQDRALDLTGIRRVLETYPQFCEAAVRLQWADADCTVHDISPWYPVGCTVWEIRFPKTDVRTDLAAHFVQAHLMRTAAEEEWAPDFWQIPAHERAYCLMQGATMYRYSIRYDGLTVCPMEGGALLEYMQDLIGADVSQLPAAVLHLLKTGESIELSRKDDFERDVLTVADRCLLLTCAGIWD